MTDIDELRRQRNAAAAAGDHGEALALNDRVRQMKNNTVCPVCGTPITRNQHMDIEEDLAFESPNCPICCQTYAQARSQ